MKPALLLLLLTGCVDTTTLVVNHGALKTAVADAQTRERCAPKDLAVAEAELAFADIELRAGDARRALEHVERGRASIGAAAQCPSKMSVDGERLTIEAPVATSASATRVTTPGDTDRDGIPDDDDICINDAEDLDGFKDSDGCPELDNDSDGITDASDRCRDAAEDKDGFQDNDGCPDADNDNDGVTDARDGCPDQAGLAAMNGCPSTDTDADGVGDSADRCPTAPETRNGFADDDGCPDSAPLAAPTGLATRGNDQILLSRPVEFDTGKSSILGSSYAVLDSVAAILKADPALKVEIGGHTDNEGDDTANQVLSKDRADAVFEYLLSKGVEARRMRTVGYGETQPVDTNRTAEGRAKNRRIEFLISK